MHIARRISKAVRKHDAKARNDINTMRWKPMSTVLEGLDPLKLGRIVRIASYKMIDAENRKGWRKWEEAADLGPNALQYISEKASPNRNAHGKERKEKRGSGDDEDDKYQNGGNIIYPEMRTPFLTSPISSI